MRKLSGFGLFVVLLFTSASFSWAETIQPYMSLGSVEGSVQDAEARVTGALTGAGFEVIGSYSPAMDESLRSIVFTRGDLVGALSRLSPERLLAAALKVGLKKDGEKVKVSMVNPEFLFRAYTQDEFSSAEGALMKVHEDALSALGSEGGFSKPSPFGGGGLERDDLAGYHYMFGMEYFEDMVRLAKGAGSFEELSARVEKNLAEKKGGAELVYSIKPEGRKVAVYGVALTDKEKGEPHFLPVIGTDHAAAMPYEMIVIDDGAFMLHGRYRIAIHWPALTMMTFGKIMSTPGDIADQLKAVAR